LNVNVVNKLTNSQTIVKYEIREHIRQLSERYWKLNWRTTSNYMATLAKAEKTDLQNFKKLLRFPYITFGKMRSVQTCWEQSRYAW